MLLERAASFGRVILQLTGGRADDMIALLAVPLVIAAFRVEGGIFPAICMILAAAVIVFVIAGHDELPWQWRVGICALVFPVDLGMVVY